MFDFIKGESKAFTPYAYAQLLSYKKLLKSLVQGSKDWGRARKIGVGGKILMKSTQLTILQQQKR